jgi:hypothetical protein
MFYRRLVFLLFFLFSFLFFEFALLPPILCLVSVLVWTDGEL